MPTKPVIMDMVNTHSADILNATRETMGVEYKSIIPEVVKGDLASLKAVGQALNDYQPARNAFATNLYNFIGRIILTSKQYTNPYARFKKGMLEYGESYEEIFVEIAKIHTFNPATAENELYKREIPNIQTAFGVLNYQKFYKTTTSDEELLTAFMSWDGISNLISGIITTLYTAENYDEFLIMKYMIARNVLNGNTHSVVIPPANDINARKIATQIKSVSNQYEFMSKTYNYAGVLTNVAKPRQALFVNSDFDAVMDVEVLATSFNMSKAEFMGQRILVDSFSNWDTNRLDDIMATEPDYLPFTQADLTLLSTVPCVLMDENWFMIFDKLNKMGDKYNEEGLYRNYWLHIWKILSVSPFSNITAFTSTASTVTSVSITPKTTTAKKGSKKQFMATVVTTGLASKSVQWVISGNTSSATTISIDGSVVIANNEDATTLTVKAMANDDNSKVDTATITVT